MLHEHSDEELMVLVAQGHRLAFDHLVRRHLTRAYGVAYRLSGNAAESEDIAQEAFTRVWQRAATWRDGKARFVSWFYRVLANVAIDRARQRKPGTEVDWVAAAGPVDRPVTSDPEQVADSAPNAEATLADRQAAQRVHRAVAALPERQRLALTLCYFEGFSNQQAADILGLHVKAVEGLLVRARRGLKDALRDLVEQ